MDKHAAGKKRTRGGKSARPSHPNPSHNTPPDLTHPIRSHPTPPHPTHEKEIRQKESRLKTVVTQSYFMDRLNRLDEQEEAEKKRLPPYVLKLIDGLAMRCYAFEMFGAFHRIHTHTRNATISDAIT